MKVFVGSDHRGVTYKKAIVEALKAMGHEAMDLGSHSETEACDYPEIALKVGREVKAHPDSRGILLCMTGIGQTIAANKVPGIYAALVRDEEMAALARQHNDSNVLVIGTKYTTQAESMKIIKVWLNTAFEGGRHTRRKALIQDMERKFLS